MGNIFIVVNCCKIFFNRKNLCIIDLYDLFYINLRGRIVKSYMNKIFIIFYVIFIEKFIIIK